MPCTARLLALRAPVWGLRGVGVGGDQQPLDNGVSNRRLWGDGHGRYQQTASPLGESVWT